MCWHSAYNEVHDNSSDNAAIYIYNSTNTTIECNLVYDVDVNDGIKMGIKGGGDAASTGGSILYNTIHSTAEDGISIYASDTTVQGNEVYNSSSSNGAIYATFSLSNISIVENYVHDNTSTGIRIAGTPGPATTIVNNNNIVNNSDGVNNTATAQLDAENNWWGAADGPSVNGPGSGDAVSLNVDFDPWLASPQTIDDPCIPAIPPEPLDLSATISLVGNTTIVPGNSKTIEIVITNHGTAEAAQNPTILLQLDDLGYTLLNLNDGNNNNWRISNGLTLKRRSPLPADTSETIRVRVQIDADAHYAVDAPSTQIRAFVSADNPDPTPGNNVPRLVGGTDYQVQAQANLSIEKTLIIDNVAPGGTALYEIIVCNTGPSDIAGIAVEDAVGTNLVGPAILSDDADILYISAGQCVDVMASAQVDVSTTPGDTFENSANVNTDNVLQGAGATQPAVVNAPAVGPVAGTVGATLPEADLHISDWVCDSVKPGAQTGNTDTTCMVTFENLGPGAAHDVTLAHRLRNIDPKNQSIWSNDTSTTQTGIDTDRLWNCSNGFNCTRREPMPTGVEDTVTFRFITDSDAHLAYREQRQARAEIWLVSDSPDSANVVNNFRAVNLDVEPIANVRIEKLLLTPNVAPGGTALFAVTLYNDGPADVDGIRIDDTLIAGAGFGSIQEIAPADAANSGLYIRAGGEETILVSVLVNDDTAPGSLITNEAAVNIDSLDAGMSTLATTSGYNGNLNALPIADTADLTVGTHLPSVDLAVEKTDFVTGISGDDLTWTIEVSNDGPGIAENVVLRDLANLFSSQLENFRITQFIDAPLDANDQPRSCVGGTNGVQCQLGAIAPGETVFIEVTATAKRTPEACGFGLNSAYVGADNPELDFFDNGDLFNGFEIDCDVALTVEKTVLKDAICLEAYGLYEVTVTNDGPTDAEDVQVRDELPAGLIYGGTSSGCFSAGTGPNGGALVQCDLGDLAYGESASALIGFNMNLDVTSPPFIVDGQTVGPNVARSRANTSFDGIKGPFASGEVNFDAVFCALPPTDIDATTTITPLNTAVAGEIYEFEVGIANLGPNPAEGVTVHHLFTGLPGDWQLVQAPATAPNWQCDGQGMTCTRQNPMPIGHETVATFRVLLPADTGTDGFFGPLGDKTIGQVLSATADNPDPVLDNNQHALRTPVTTESTLEIRKEALEPEIVAGGPAVAFKIFVNNTGPSDAYDVVIADDPGTLTLLSMSSSNTPMTCIFGTCTIDVLPAGEETIIDVLISATPDLAPGDYVNTAEIMECRNDANNICNLPTPATAEAPITVVGWADLKLQKFAKPDGIVGAGEPFQFIIFVDNLGVSTATDLTVEDTIFSSGPFEVTGITADQGATCTPTSGAGDAGAPFNFSCTLATLDRYSRLAITIDAIAYEEVDVNNEARVYAADPQDPDMSNNSDTASMSVQSYADLSLQKFVKPDGAIAAGDPFQFHIFVDNLGVYTATDVIIEDTTFASGPFEVTGIDGGGATCTPTSGTGDVNAPFDFTCELAELGPNERITIIVDAVADEPVDVNNEAHVHADAPRDPDMSNNSDTASMSVGGLADVSVEKAAVTTAINAGETASWTITVNNDGPSAAENVVVEDILPSAIVADTVVISPDTYGCTVGTPGDPGDPTICNLGNMDAGAAPIVLTISGQVSPDYRGSPEIVNDVSVDSDTADPDRSNNRDTANVAVTGAAGIGITKESQPAMVKAGETVDYAITVSNGGPSIATNVAVTDAIPAEMTYNSAEVVGGNGTECSYAPGSRTVSCLLGDLTVNSSTQILINVTVKATTPPGDVLNTATVTSDSGETQMDDATTTITVESGLSATKRSSSLSPATGEIYSYAVEVTNHGPSVAENVLVEDEFTGSVNYLFSRGAQCTKIGENQWGDDQVECNLGTLAPGQTVTFDFVVQVNDWVWDGHKSDNMIKVTSTTPGANGQPATTVAYSEEIVFRNTNDLKIRKFGKPDGTVDAGNKLTYTIIVDNFGPGYAYNPHVRDFLASDGTYTFAAPSFCTPSSGTATGNQELDCALETIKPGEQAVFTVEVTASESQTVNNTAEVSADGADLDQDNNYAIVEHEIDAVADLRVSKTVDSSMIDAGNVARYTITVHNDGPSTANNVVVMDTLPGGASVVTIDPSQGSCTTAPVKCNLGNLGSGQTAQVVLRAEINADIAPETVLINNVAVLSDAFDDDMGDNLASVSVTVKANHALHVEKSASTSASVKAGDEVDFRILVRNTGKSTIHNVVIKDDLPSDLHFVSYSIVGNVGSCVDTLFSPEVVCDVGTIAPNEERTIYIRTQIDPGAQSGTLINLVSPDSRFDASSDLSGAVSVVNSAHVRLETVALVTVVRPGDIFAYLVRVINEGPSMAKYVTVNVDLPEHLSYVSDTIGCGETLQSCLVGDMEPNTQREFQVLVKIDEGALNVTQVVVTASAATTTTNATFDTSQASAMVIVNGNAGHIFMPMINR